MWPVVAVSERSTFKDRGGSGLVFFPDLPPALVPRLGS